MLTNDNYVTVKLVPIIIVTLQSSLRFISVLNLALSLDCVLVSGLLADLVFPAELGVHYNICVDVIIVVLFTNLASATCRQKRGATGEDGGAV